MRNGHGWHGCVMTRHSFCPGITTLLSGKGTCSRTRESGLISHPAAVDSNGTSSADLLARHSGARLSALFGPSTAFSAPQLPGRAWLRRGILFLAFRFIHSMESAENPAGHVEEPGSHRVRPAGYRRPAYTYVSTLRLVLEAAAEQEKPVIVADRPIPLPCVADGPVTEHV